MTAEELLKAGHLSAAVEQLNQEVRSRPTDIQRRTFLFELLCFAGDYQRAERQLDVLGHQSATAEIGVQVYRHILDRRTGAPAALLGGRAAQLPLSSAILRTPSS